MSAPDQKESPGQDLNQILEKLPELSEDELVLIELEISRLKSKSLTPEFRELLLASWEQYFKNPDTSPPAHKVFEEMLKRMQS